MNIFHKIHLKIFGFCKVGETYYINCYTHGLQKAISHGYDNITCILCMKEMLLDYDRRNEA